MKKYSLAAIVLATTLVVAPPSALCDSFGYRTSGSKVGSNSSLRSGREGALSGIAEIGIFANSDLSNSSGSNYGGAFGSSNAEHPIDGAFFFDKQLRGGTETGQQNNIGALVDLNGQELVLLSGIEGGGSSPGGKNGQFFFADNGAYHVSNELQRGNGTIGSTATALTVTPEPGSLFLLGTGLLGLALVLFWKAAKRSTGS
jgi:hypothetical protein